MSVEGGSTARCTRGVRKGRKGGRGGCGVGGENEGWVLLPSKELENLYFFEGQWIRSFGLADEISGQYRMGSTRRIKTKFPRSEAGVCGLGFPHIARVQPNVCSAMESLGRVERTKQVGVRWEVERGEIPPNLKRTGRVERLGEQTARSLADIRQRPGTQVEGRSRRLPKDGLRSLDRASDWRSEPVSSIVRKTQKRASINPIV